MNTEVMFSSRQQDWETPAALFHQLQARYGFALDAAATTGNAKCPRWFGPGGEAEDALTARWPDDVAIWLNPPYREQRPFIEKVLDVIARRQLDGSRGQPIVCLLPARPDTALFHDLIRPWGEVEFLRGRLRFVGAAASAPFPSMLVTFR